MTLFSIRTLVLERELAGARPGMCRAEIGHALGEPDQWTYGDERERATIWRYGTFEVHFDEDLAWLLYVDGLHQLDAGPDRALDGWVVVDGARTTLGRVRDALLEAQAVYTEGRDPLDHTVLCVGPMVQLSFGKRDDGEYWSAISVGLPDRLCRITGVQAAESGR